MALVLSDDFNRADSNTIGGSWSDISIGAEDAGILSNRLAFPVSGADNDAAVAHQSIASYGYNNITVRFVFRLSSASTNPSDFAWVSVQHDGSSRNAVIGGLCVGISVGTPRIWVMDQANANNTRIDVTTYPLTTNTDYYVRWDIESDNSMRLYVNTAGFASMTSSDLLGSSGAYTPSSSRTRLALGNRYNQQFDSIELYSPVESAISGSPTPPSRLMMMGVGT